MKMINEFKEIVKNYYNLINEDKKKLIPYYIGYFLKEVLELVIPIFVARITENLTNSLYIAATASIVTHFFLKILNNIMSYFTMYMYQNFYQDNYITIYKKIVKKIYCFDEEYKERISTEKIINSLISDIINIGEMADNILAIILNMLKCIVVLFYFFKINIFLAMLTIIVDLVYVARSNYLNNMVIKYSKEQKKEYDNLIGLTNQILLGLKDIQTLDISISMDNKYDLIYKSWKKIYNNKKKYERYRKSILKCFLIVFKTILYFICMELIINKHMTIGVMLIVISYFDTLFSSSENIMSASQMIREQNISGGQKRLLSLARILLKESKILIFDEMTSSLDIDKIQNITNLLKELRSNHTIIVITHKKELMDIADETIVLDKGKVQHKDDKSYFAFMK
ncbi:MAG: ABC transporter ATP-binding protein [Clostridia bacterium]|nr:ABC transporter ATP-binding protein [Clostridia bacterium]